MNILYDAQLRGCIEIDENVTAKDNVEGPKRANIEAQIEQLERHHAPQDRLNLPRVAGTLRAIFVAKRQRQASFDFNLVVDAGRSTLQDGRGYIRAYDTDIPGIEAHFAQHHGETVGFLAGGRSG